jgi:uncharacterized repeat protein (TIGR03803 family)
MTRRRHPRPVISLLCLFLAIVASSVPASADWKEKVLYSFHGIPDGLYPIGALAFDKAGNLYGATSWGGADTCQGIGQCGTVYQLQPPAQKGGPWSENELYIFKGKNSNDGETPAGGVIFDASGNLYGTTAYGGSGSCMLLGGLVGCGTVYKMTPAKTEGDAWTESVVYSFQGGKDGYLPNGDLTFDSAGNLYGATQYGGGYGSCNSPLYQYCGTIFKLSPPNTKGGKWTEKVLYSFKSGTDGANPNGGLLFDSKGVIYGTTSSGGDHVCKTDTSVGCGTAYKLTPPEVKGKGWTESILHSFVNYTHDGGIPKGGLISDAKGRLYSTTSGGGSGEDGVIFRLAEPKSGGPWIEAVLHAFRANTGWDSLTGMLADPLGYFYGSASGGGKVGGGTVFKLNPRDAAGQNFSLLHSFTGTPDGQGPAGRLLFDKAGNLYGGTQIGGTGPCRGGGCGTVFEVAQ